MPEMENDGRAGKLVC